MADFFTSDLSGAEFDNGVVFESKFSFSKSKIFWTSSWDQKLSGKLVPHNISIPSFFIGRFDRENNGAGHFTVRCLKNE